jgi:hypothetical protein
MRVFLTVLPVLFLISSCSFPEKFECPCGGHGVVAHGTIVTIDEKNKGDTKAILDAIEERLGGECCYYGEN